MKTTGMYDRCESPFEIEHEIEHYCNQIKGNIIAIDTEYSRENAKLVKKAMIETLLESI